MSGPDTPDSRILNALTIDVEDYFQVSALAPHIERAAWERMPSRVVRNVFAGGFLCVIVVLIVVIKRERARRVLTGNPPCRSGSET